MSHWSTTTGFRVAAAILATSLLAACSHDGGASGDRTTIDLTHTDAGSSITVEPGDTVTVSLEGNPTTGYTWEPDDIDPDVLRLMGEPAYASDGELVGSGGVFTFTYEVVGIGEADLTLVYHRPWESVSPIDSFTVHVTAG